MKFYTDAIIGNYHYIASYDTHEEASTAINEWLCRCGIDRNWSTSDDGRHSSVRLNDEFHATLTRVDDETTVDELHPVWYARLPFGPAFCKCSEWPTYTEYSQPIFTFEDGADGSHWVISANSEVEARQLAQLKENRHANFFQRKAANMLSAQIVNVA